MGFPIKTCSKCGEEFELKPDKPGYAHQCPDCSEPEEIPGAAQGQSPEKTSKEANEARREAMKNLLYRKDS